MELSASARQSSKCFQNPWRSLSIEFEDIVNDDVFFRGISQKSLDKREKSFVSSFEFRVSSFLLQFISMEKPTV
jgi:hypothetical protein